MAIFKKFIYTGGIMKKVLSVLVLSSLALFAKEPSSKSYPNIKVVSSIFLDAGWTKDSSDSELRRARVSLKGDLMKDLSYELEYSFPRGGKWKDIYLKYQTQNCLSIKAGHIKEPFGLEALTSLKYNSFMERSLSDIFINDRKLGLNLGYYNKLGDGLSMTFDIGAFGQSINDYKSSHHNYTIASRSTLTKHYDKHSLWHLGASVAYDDHDSHKRKFKARPESHMAGKYIKTKVKHADNSKRYGIEGYWQANRVSFMSEYITEDIEDEFKNDFKASGWYAQISYFLTDDHKRFKNKSATLSRVKPKNPFNFSTLKGLGAIESALRVSSLDIADFNLGDDDYLEYTLALNWYLNKNARLEANYIKSDLDIVGLDTPDIMQVRFEYDF